MSLRTRPMSPFGTEVIGVDFEQPLSEDTIAGDYKLGRYLDPALHGRAPTRHFND